MQHFQTIMGFRPTRHVNRHISCGASPVNRQGAAAVEAAILLPVFVLIFLALIDIGQAINLRHVVENAAREAARMAAKDEHESAAEIHTAVVEHMKSAYPNIVSASIEQAVSTNVYYVDTLYGGNTIYTPEDLAEIPSGQSVHVEVSFDFDQVRWLPGFDWWNTTLFESVSICRRE